MGWQPGEPPPGWEPGGEPPPGWEPPPPPPGGNNPPNRPPFITLFSELTDLRSHELNRIKLDRETSKHFARVAQANGVPLTPVEMFRMLMDMLSMPPDETVHRVAITIGVREVEDKLREGIQQTCNRIDAHLGQPFGTTNRAIRTHFDKSRTEMTIAELQAVWAYVNTLWEKAMGP